MSSSCVSHFHVDERLHIGELEAEEEAHKLDIPLLHCQVKNCLVAFDFLKKMKVYQQSETEATSKQVWHE